MMSLDTMGVPSDIESHARLEPVNASTFVLLSRIHISITQTKQIEVKMVSDWIKEPEKVKE